MILALKRAHCCTAWQASTWWGCHCHRWRPAASSASTLPSSSFGPFASIAGYRVTFVLWCGPLYHLPDKKFLSEDDEDGRCDTQGWCNYNIYIHWTGLLAHTVHICYDRPLSASPLPSYSPLLTVLLLGWSEIGQNVTLSMLFPNYKIACLTVMLLFNFRRASANFDFYPKKGKHNFKFEYFKAPLEAKNEKELKTFVFLWPGQKQICPFWGLQKCEKI